MKKSIVSIAILFGISLCYAAQAQNRTSWGVKLDTELTDVRMTGTEGNKFKAGAAVGGFARIGWGETFSLQPELLLGYTEAKIPTGGQRVRYKYLRVELPIYFQAGFAAGTGRVIFGAGPLVGYGLSVDSRVESLPQGAPGENTVELDHGYAGGGITAGYEFRNRISVNAGYKTEFDFSSRHKSSRVKTQTISLGAAYRF